MNVLRAIARKSVYCNSPFDRFRAQTTVNESPSIEETLTEIKNRLGADDAIKVLQNWSEALGVEETWVGGGRGASDHLIQRIEFPDNYRPIQSLPIVQQLAMA